jgi:hypothetical protein
MNQAKLQLSEEEMELATNKAFILTKQRVIQKVTVLMGGLAEAMQAGWECSGYHWPEEILHSSPKISKGEQYRQMPYVVLDYPRVFSKEHVFAIRHFFWWGHYFSSTLHLKGKYQAYYGTKVLAAIDKGWFNGYRLSVTGNEFEFDLDSDSYRAIQPSAEPVMGIHHGPFLKIARCYAIRQWNHLPEVLLEDAVKFLNCCGKV